MSPFQVQERVFDQMSEFIKRFSVLVLMDAVFEGVESRSGNSCTFPNKACSRFALAAQNPDQQSLASHAIDKSAGVVFSNLPNRGKFFQGVHVRKI